MFEVRISGEVAFDVVVSGQSKARAIGCGRLFKTLGDTMPMPSINKRLASLSDTVVLINGKDFVDFDAITMGDEWFEIDVYFGHSTELIRQVLEGSTFKFKIHEPEPKSGESVYAVMREREYTGMECVSRVDCCKGSNLPWFARLRFEPKR
jgi:hypothetical protein